jgi:ectoine hydroxylase-related dioxygenase (phytanoyl-CoA dioxygenase family)
MELTRFGARTPQEEILFVLERDGGFILEDLAPSGAIEVALSERGPWLGLPARESPLGNNAFTGMQTLRTSALVRKSRACGELAMNPLVLGIVDRILGPQCSRFQLSFTQAIAIAPGERAQMIHRDTWMYPLKRPGPEVFINAIWAASEFTETNGATVIFPGSHLWQEERRPTPADARACASMEPGSCFVYFGSVLHGGGGNVTSNQTRIGLAFGYALGWLRQEENQYLAVPPEIAKQLPVELQRLIGYCEHAPFLGWTEGQDPKLFHGGCSREHYETKIQGGRSTSVRDALRERKMDR